jgi:serine/threonine-protein kinase
MTPTEPLDPGLPDLPETLGGRYRLVERIGEGGSGIVFRATYDEGEVAVKVRTVPERPIQAARFLVESVPMDSVTHPNVVPVLATGREAGFLWIAMALYGNGTLKDLVRDRGPLPLEHALCLIEQVLDGLAAVHAAGFVHRDIKPQNIFLDDDGRAAIGDFGVARHLNGGLWFRTRTGQAIGTMGYRAPEQDNTAKDAGPPADVYGAAATLYFLAVGRRPPLLYAAEADARMLEPVPEPIRELLRRATAYDPAERPTVAAFRAQIRAARNAARLAEGLAPIEDSGSRSPLRRFLDWWTG